MDRDTEPLHKTWLHSDQLIPRRFIRPALGFTKTEASGAIVLLAATIHDRCPHLGELGMG